MKRSTSWLLLCMLTLVTIPTVMAQPNYNYSKTPTGEARTRCDRYP